VVNPDDAIAAGRRIAGLIGNSPGPGIYSRMQRAVEAMPEMVRAEELPGLIRRHKEGVPGWELKAVDLPSLYEGRAAVPREELLRAVEERSPLYTHGEVVQRGGPDDYPKSQADIEFPEFAGLFGPEPFARRIGQGIPSGKTEYGKYSQGGDDYTEILLTQPGARHWEYGNHWDVADAVAHARFDRHGDALRINELQSDLGIKNRQLREQQAKISDAIGESDFIEYSSPDPSKPFPLEDAWLDLLVKRLALEAARGGYRAIEIAAPRSIRDTVGGNIDNYEHLYGKVIPGRLERLGRKMGGLHKQPILQEAPGYGAALSRSQIRELGIEADVAQEIRRLINPGDDGVAGRLDDEWMDYAHDVRAVTEAINDRDGLSPVPAADALYKNIVTELLLSGAPEDKAYQAVGQAMPGIMRKIEDLEDAESASTRLRIASANQKRLPGNLPGVRYLMSDEMRRNILRNGIPASVLGAAALSNERQP